MSHPCTVCCPSHVHLFSSMTSHTFHLFLAWQTWGPDFIKDIFRRRHCFLFWIIICYSFRFHPCMQLWSLFTDEGFQKCSWAVQPEEIIHYRIRPVCCLDAYVLSDPSGSLIFKVLSWNADDYFILPPVFQREASTSTSLFLKGRDRVNKPVSEINLFYTMASSSLSSLLHKAEIGLILSTPLSYNTDFGDCEPRHVLMSISEEAALVQMEEYLLQKRNLKPDEVYLAKPEFLCGVFFRALVFFCRITYIHHTGVRIKKVSVEFNLIHWCHGSIHLQKKFKCFRNLIKRYIYSNIKVFFLLFVFLGGVLYLAHLLGF